MEGVFTLRLTLQELNRAKECNSYASKSPKNPNHKGIIALFMAFILLLAFATSNMPLLAYSSSVENVQIMQNPESLKITATWAGGDMLTLNITDFETNQCQEVMIRLSDFIHEDENAQYILLQAMDFMGIRQSGIIQIENPLYEPNRVLTDTEANIGVEIIPVEIPAQAPQITMPTPEVTGPAALQAPNVNIPVEANQTTGHDTTTQNAQNTQSLTPDGTGTVVDNIVTVNEIEFFTVSTESGNDFFLVIDRQRTSNNVYLLNHVTESDLLALAQARGESLDIAAVQQPEAPQVPTLDEIMLAVQESLLQQSQETAQAINTQPQPQTSQSNAAGIVLIIVVLLALGGGGFYAYKILLPKLQKANNGNDAIEEDEDENDEYSEYEDGEIDYENLTISDDEDEYYGMNTDIDESKNHETDVDFANERFSDED